MVAPELTEAYHKYVPRWFKVIKWRAWGVRQVVRAKFIIPFSILPVWWAYFGAQSAYPIWLCVKQPQTDEERLALKRDSYYAPFQRDWQLGQYNHERPPYIDLWKRRRNYPEYYEGKYEGYRQDAVYYQSPSLVGSGIVVDPYKQLKGKMASA